MEQQQTTIPEPPVTHHYTGEEVVDGSIPPYKDVEVATVSSDISAIGDSAFCECRKLHTISIPNNIQTIGEYSFNYCTSLTSISLPASVATIQRYAFYGCSKLTNIDIPPSSNLTTIGESAFYNCSSLTSISLPPSLTTIGDSAFENCTQLQMITLPKHATVEDDAFYECDMLKRSNQPDIATWLKTRFDDLPLHQLCYNISDTTTDISTIQIDNQALTTQDALGMTPIHVLLSKPFTTPNMIKQLVSNNRDAAQVRNVNGKTPLHMYLEKIKCPQSVEDELLQDGAEYDIHDMVEMGLGYEVMEVVLALSGRRIEAELNNCNEETGFYPFMSAAISHKCKLMDVYKMAIENVDNL